MNPVDQTRTGNNGNCMQAVLATLLGVPLGDVPDFCNIYPAKDWYDHLVRWLVVARHKAYVSYGVENQSHVQPLIDSGILYVEAGESKSTPGIQHAVISQNGKMVFDPNPLREGIVCTKSIEFMLDLPDARLQTISTVPASY
jgi:hypothetical protein